MSAMLGASPSALRTAPSRRRDAAYAALVGVVALVTRLAVASTAPEYPLIADLQEYWDRAVHFFEHGSFPQNAWRMPGYPVALALAFAIGSGPSLFTIRVFNALAGAATALLTYWFARRAASHRAALVAALVVALYPTFLLYTTLVATEAVVTVPTLGALIAASYRSAPMSAISGICAGLAALVRPAGIATLPAVLLAVAWRPNEGARRRWAALPAALAMVAFVATMAPWWIHNARAFSRFVPFDTTGGYAFLVGNISYGTGLWEWDVVGRMEGELRRAGIDWTTPAGADATTAMAIRDIRADPQTAIRRVPAKVAGLLAIEGREHAYVYSHGFLGARGNTTVWLWGVAIMAAFPLLLAAALAALAIRGNVRSGVYASSAAYIATTVVMHMISLGDPRYHLPLVPALAVLATGLEQWRNGISSWRLLLAVAVILALSAPWSTQLSRYWALLSQLAGPGGWAAAVPFIDLL